MFALQSVHTNDKQEGQANKSAKDGDRRHLFLNISRYSGSLRIILSEFENDLWENLVISGPHTPRQWTGQP